MNKKLPYKVIYVQYKSRTPAERKRWYAKTKWGLFNKILDHYGRRCNCPGCLETNVKFLTIDHVNNNGSEHRKSITGQTLGIYRDIINRGFPDDFQIMCHNCNWGKARYGKCPHMDNI